MGTFEILVALITIGGSITILGYMVWKVNTDETIPDYVPLHNHVYEDSRTIELKKEAQEGKLQREKELQQFRDSVESSMPEVQGRMEEIKNIPLKEPLEEPDIKGRAVIGGGFVEDAKIERFMRELYELCSGYDLIIEHEDKQGCFIINKFNNFDWLRHARVDGALVDE